MKNFIKVILVLVMCNILFAQTLEQDSLALVALYDSTDGENWTNNNNWLNGPVHTWYGITFFNNGVKGVNLRNNNLKGNIPPEIGNLTNLTYLQLNDNQLSGLIPHEIGNLSSIDYLFLYGNNLTGSIPPEIGNLTNLTYLYLNDNQLSGLIPHEIGNLSSIEYLVLYGNNLTGLIPYEIGNLTNLTHLDLSHNQLSGLIPHEIGNLTNLTHLDLSHNQLSGLIPPEICHLSSIESLSLYGNNLTGLIPHEIGNLSNLTDLVLGNNQLSGSIPHEIRNLKNLNSLQLNDNQLIGSIPSEIGDLTNLKYLNLDENQLSYSIPHEIGNLSSIEYLFLAANNLTGSIPPEICKLSNLRYLWLSLNHLNGSIPNEIGNLTSVEDLNLWGNKLTGAVPNEICNLDNLTFLNLQSNQLVDLPDLSSMTSLERLLIYNNKFTFEDIEPNLDIPDIRYSPQLAVGREIDTSVVRLSNVVLSVSVGGSQNRYQWVKEYSLIEGAKSATLVINKIDNSDFGSYYCLITSNIVLDLVLGSSPINIGSFQGPQATTLEPGILLEHQAILQGLVNPNGFTTDVRFEYGETLDYAYVYEIEESIEDVLEEFELRCEVKNLKENTEYHYRVIAENDRGIDYGEDQTFTTKATPTQYSIGLNYPNPFNPKTTIPIEVPSQSFITVSIYNILGQKVKTLYEGNVEAETINLIWNATDNFGRQLPSGIYFCMMNSKNGVMKSRRLILLR